MVRFRPSRAGRVLLTAIALSTLFPAPALQAQEPTEASSEAGFVRLDVFATRDGAAVTDLTAGDVEVEENDVIQDVATFERVAPLETPAGDAGAAARRDRRRVFVLYLDAPHLSAAATSRLRETIVPKLDALIGPDDLLGIMTSEVSAGNLTLAPKTQPLGEVLEPYWPMSGELDPDRDHSDAQYLQCYPPATGEIISRTAREMIERRRERITVDVLIDLTRHLSTARDERKAVILLSEGWVRHPPDPGLAGQGEKPSGPRMRVGSDGMPYAIDPADPQSQARFRCDTDRLRLSQLDNARGFEALVNEANLANVSFYAIDPDGPPEETPPPVAARAAASAPPQAPPPAAPASTPGAPPAPQATALPAPPPTPASALHDPAASQTRRESLAAVSTATDGMAALDPAALDAVLGRLATDLAGYYLVGYFSSLIGREAEFRTVRVRSARPGVELRTRRGYRTPARRETLDVEPVVDAPVVRGSDLETVRRAPLPLGRLEAGGPGDTFRVMTVPGLASGEAGRVWIVGELEYRAAQEMEWRHGARATVIVSTSGEKVIEEQVSIAPGERTFVMSLTPPREPGGYLVQVRLAPGPPGKGKELGGAGRFDVAAPGEEASIRSPLLFRRGPMTGGRYLPTADVRFRRNEILRVSAPVADGMTNPEIRILGRDAQAIDIPVTATIVRGAPERDQDTPGEAADAWIVGPIPLAPLAPGEYVVEITGVRDGKPHGVRVPFRLIP